MLPSISGWRASAFATRESSKENTASNTGLSTGSTQEPVPLGRLGQDVRTIDPIRVSLQDSIVRGTGEFLLEMTAQKTEVEWQNGLLAIDGRFLEYGGARYAERIPLNVRVRLEHVTAMTKRGFARLRYSSLAEHPVCLSCILQSCAFITDADAAFFEFEGVEELNGLKAVTQDDRAWAKWLDVRGMDNAYDSDIQELIRLRLSGKIVARFDFESAIRNILMERAPEPNVRWITKPSSMIAPHRQSVGAFRQRPGTFESGMKEELLPKIDSAETSLLNEG